MGTYTNNYNLFLPTVGEQGWGELVNGNFTTIDTTMKSLDTRLTAVENEVDGALSCTSVTTSGKVTANGGVETTSLTTSGTITSTGLITANGGVKGNVTGSATSLNKTVTVSPSTTKLTQQHTYNKNSGAITVCPYVPGVLYNGSVKGRCANKSYPSKMYVLSSSNSWSIVNINSESDNSYSFTNVKCITVSFATYNSSEEYIYLPIYS